MSAKTVGTVTGDLKHSTKRFIAFPEANGAKIGRVLPEIDSCSLSLCLVRTQFCTLV